jgi:hypothetical protein
MNTHEFWHGIKATWQPHPVSAPRVDHEFMGMNGLNRATESWRFNILSLEYWLSPGGVLRQFIQLMIWLAILLLTPVLLIFPLITFILATLVKWTVLLTSIAWKLIILPILFLIGAIVTAFNWLVFKAFISSRR